MKFKNGFTLIEVIAVIALIALMTLLIVPNITKNIKDAKQMLSNSQIEAIENAAYVYYLDYSSEIPNLNTYNVANVTIETLISKGLISSDDIKINNQNLPISNVVVIANINGIVKTFYDVNQTGKSVIFLVGLSTISVNIGTTYNDMGAYVAIQGSGVLQLSSSNMISTVNTSTSGTYTVTYSYTNALDAIRTVKVL